jgi:hypothetical protein
LVGGRGRHHKLAFHKLGGKAHENRTSKLRLLVFKKHSSKVQNNEASHVGIATAKWWR